MAVLRTEDDSADLADHPLPAMLDAGLLVTVNSDGPAYSGGYAGDNFDAVAESLPLDHEVLRTFAANSFRAAFLDEPTRDAHLARWRPTPSAEHVRC